MKHFDNDGVTVFGGIPFQSSYRHKLFERIIKKCISKQRIWSPIYRREVIKYDEKTGASNDGAFEWG